MAYSTKEIENMLNTNMFYRKECLNYIGNISDENDNKFNNKPYYEFIASYLLRNYDKKSFEKLLCGNIKFEKKKQFTPIIRKINYGDKTNRKIYNNRHEEKIVMNLIDTKNTVDGFVSKLNQVPVNRQDKNAHGKVDLVLTNDKNDMIIAEVKDNNSPETLLRAIIEIITYKVKIDKNWKVDGCCDDFKFLDKDKNIRINKIIPAVMIFESKSEIGIVSEPWEEYNLIKNDKKSSMHKLIKRLIKDYGLRFFEIEDKDNTFEEVVKPKDYSKKKYYIRKLDL